MKIAILGTSNSAMSCAYADAIRQRHEVINFSVGRVPATFHIRTILNKWTTLAQCDLIILDHYINDVNTYLPRTSAYLPHVQSLYSLLAQLQRPVLNVLFPISDLPFRPEYWYPEYIKQLSSSAGFSCIDLNVWPFTPSSFEDELHLRREVSYAIGIYLLECIANATHQSPRVRGRAPLEYRLVSAKAVACTCNMTTHPFRNSLIDLEYLPITVSTLISDHEMDFASWQPVSIGYLNKTDHISAARLISENSELLFSVGGQGYYHELLPEDFPPARTVLLAPHGEGGEYPSLIGRHGSFFPQDDNPPFNFCDLLFARPV